MGDEVRVLSAREINRAVLARQLLLQRAPLGPAAAVELVAGLQTQYAPSGYVGLWSRLASFERAALTDALLERRVVQAWMMRCTIHMVSAADYAPLTEAVRLPRRTGYLRTTPDAAGWDLPAAADAVRRYLADGPLKQAELQKRLAADGFARGVWPGVQLYVDLVRVPPAGTWDLPRAHVYGLADQWLGPLPPVSAQEGEERLAIRYLRGFGPASVRDVGLFCGWTITAARAVLERCAPRRFTDSSGGELFDVADAPLPPPDTPAPVRFLGQWDAVLLVHARRAQILPEPYRRRVFATTTPQSVPTFLVDGQVAGTWRHVDGVVRTEPFHDLPAGAVRAVQEEAERLTAFYGSSK